MTEQLENCRRCAKWHQGGRVIDALTMELSYMTFIVRLEEVVLAISIQSFLCPAQSEDPEPYLLLTKVGDN